MKADYRPSRLTDALSLSPFLNTTTSNTPPPFCTTTSQARERRVGGGGEQIAGPLILRALSTDAGVRGPAAAAETQRL